jgi:hypothetical protein
VFVDLGWTRLKDDARGPQVYTHISSGAEWAHKGFNWIVEPMFHSQILHRLSARCMLELSR